MDSSDTFCVRFWTALDVASDGTVRPCCSFTSFVECGGKPVRFAGITPVEGLCSASFASWRKQALLGQPVEGCRYCYIKERDGCVSDRMLYNKAYAYLHHQDPRMVFTEAAPEKLKPRALSLHLGTLCNLKCRMCGPQASSRIAGDAVHQGWACQEPDIARFVKSDAPDAGWGHDASLLLDKVAQVADILTDLHVSGGEPLIMPMTQELCRYLVDTGRCDITLAMPSNGTRIALEMLDLLAAFSALNIRLSIDGSQAVDEYIRFPSQWDEVEATVAKLKALPNVHLTVGFTLSAYNIFEPIKVVEWAHAKRMRFEYGFVEKPFFIRPGVMPSAVLRQAAGRIAAFLGRQPTSQDPDSPRSRSLDQLKGLHSYMLNLADKPDRDRSDAFREFMQFTNALDHDRGQSVADSCPELTAALQEAGVTWVDHPDTAYYAACARRSTHRFAQRAKDFARNAIVGCRNFFFSSSD